MKKRGKLLLFEAFSEGVVLLVPALGFRLRVWMPSFFMANGRLTCRHINTNQFRPSLEEEGEIRVFLYPPPFLYIP